MRATGRGGAASYEGRWAEGAIGGQGSGQRAIGEQQPATGTQICVQSYYKDKKLNY